MTQALIQVNGVTGSNDDLPINTLVQLNNVNNGGESTFSWLILDQPPGPADALSNATIQNPTFTPKKEGTYLLKLTVNQSLADQQQNSVVVGIRSLKTRERLIAVGETQQDSLTLGWGETNRSWLRRVDNLYNVEFGVMVGTAHLGGLFRGICLFADGYVPIKTGLPGQEFVPRFLAAFANVPNDIDGPLFILEGGVDGNPTPAMGALIRARHLGVFGPTTGAGAVGDIVYVSDGGILANAPGTNTRKVGKIIDASGGIFMTMFTGAMVP